jgi:hypothetical protein
MCLTTHHKDYIRWWLDLLRKVDKSLEEPHPRSVHPFTRQMALHTLHVIHGICSLSLLLSLAPRKVQHSTYEKALAKSMNQSSCTELKSFICSWNFELFMKWNAPLLLSQKPASVCHQKRTLSLCFPNIFVRGSLLASKYNHGSSHPCWRKYRMSWWQISKIKNFYLRTDFW